MQSRFPLLRHVFVPVLIAGNHWPPEEHSSASSSAHSLDAQHNSSPWTYENETLNPALRPSNSQIRESSTRKRRNVNNAGVSALPPYHPDYEEGEQNNYEPEYAEESDGSYTEEGAAAVRVRRGSEGYEVRPQGREEMLRRYLEEMGEEPGRYIRYIPQPESEESGDDDDIPLAYRGEIGPMDIHEV